MSATSATLRGRSAAERLMTDTCTIRRVTGQATDAETGVVTNTYTTVYSGRCKVQQRGASGGNTDVGQAAIVLVSLELHIPASATGVTTDDIATITASALDADLVGRMFHLTGVAHKSYLTARRFPMVEVTS